MRTRTPSCPNPTLSIAAGALTILLTAGAANAQNALGNGRALDSNLQQGRTVNPLGRNTNIAAEVAYRNALVTGNAANGMSFRESVGYTSTFDFRTDIDPETGRAIPLPSNDIYNFMRDSLTSSYPSLGLRGIDALREQAAWSTGNTFDESLNVPILRRAGIGESGAQLSYEQKLVREGYETSFIDPFRIRPRSMRSTAEFTIGNALGTRFLGQTQDEATNQIQFLQATPLRGVVSESVVTENMIRIYDGKSIGAPNLISSVVSDIDDSDALDNKPFGYDAVVKRMSDLFNERYAQPEPDDETATEPDDASTNPIDTTGQGTTGQIDFPTLPTTTPRETTQDALDRLRSQLLGLPTTDEPEDEAQDESVVDTLRKLFSDEDGSNLSRIDRLAPKKTNRNLFAENMRTGEAMLAKSQWFDAEERFSAALRLSPGDPMAAVGRLHAQLGAGLYLSAGVNFDRLFRANPELMAAKYDQKLLPRHGRLKRIDARLRLNTRNNSDLAVSSALLMAYLGYQFDDRPTIEDAFAALDRIHAERGEEPDILETTLREVWLGQ